MWNMIDDVLPGERKRKILIKFSNDEIKLLNEDMRLTNGSVFALKLKRYIGDTFEVEEYFEACKPIAWMEVPN
jgi:hypothetical protein